MKRPEVIEESMERFKSRFWDSTESSRPPVGVVEADSFLPVQYLRSRFVNDNITVRMLKMRILIRTLILFLLQHHGGLSPGSKRFAGAGFTTLQGR